MESWGKEQHVAEYDQQKILFAILPAFTKLKCQLSYFGII